MTPRHILLAVAGATAATITEALWALAVARKLAIHELRVLTTRGARERIEAGLASALARLRDDYPKARVPLEVEWRMARGAAGKELEDVRTSADNEALADWILAEARDACSQPGTEVHASLAGGRKTMSFYLGATMQLCGRPQDRLYHVLVDEAFEAPGFWYPRPPGTGERLRSRSGEVLDPSTARVELADVPLVRVGPLLARGDVAALDFGRLVARATDALSASWARVRVSVPERGKSGKATISFRAGKGPPVIVDFQSRATGELVFYTWLLWRQKHKRPPMRLMDAAAFNDHMGELLDVCDLLGLDRDEQKSWRKFTDLQIDALRERKLEEFMEADWYATFKVYPSRLRKRLHATFLEQASGLDPSKYEVKLHNKAISLDIPAGNIELPDLREETRA